jgi:ComEC/Rec2-related protein
MIQLPWSFFYTGFYVVGILLSTGFLSLAFFLFLFLRFFKSTPNFFWRLAFLLIGFLNIVYKDHKIKDQFKNIFNCNRASGYAIKSIYQDDGIYQTEYYISDIFDKNQQSYSLDGIISCKTKTEIPLYKPSYLSYIAFKPKEDQEALSKSKHILCYGIVSFIKKKLYIQQYFFWRVISSIATYINIKKNIFLRFLHTNYPNSTLFLKILLNAPIPKSFQNKYDNQKELFQAWGIHHYLARSGLHIVIILAILMSFLAIFNIRSMFIYIISLFFLFIFSLFTWTGISYLRASLMWILMILSRLFRVYSYNLHTWSLCTLFFLILNPFYLFNLEFQLSFGATFFLILWFHLQRSLKFLTF